jgi:hypothetical protein
MKIYGISKDFYKSDPLPPRLLAKLMCVRSTSLISFYLLPSTYSIPLEIS